MKTARTFEFPVNFWERENGLGPNEPELYDALGRLTVPLYTSLGEEYGADRGEFVCGPSEAAVGHIVSHNIDLPFEAGTKREHLELEIGIYRPQGATKGVDHSYLIYDAGNREDNVYIDHTARRIWEGATDFSESVRADWLPWVWQRTMMIELYSIHPFEASLGERIGVDLWGDGEIGYRNLAGHHHDFIKIMHSPQIFENYVLTRSGEVYDTESFWGDRFVRVVRATAQRAGMKSPV